MYRLIVLLVGLIAAGPAWARCPSTPTDCPPMTTNSPTIVGVVGGGATYTAPTINGGALGGSINATGATITGGTFVGSIITGAINGFAHPVTLGIIGDSIDARGTSVNDGTCATSGRCSYFPRGAWSVARFLLRQQIEYSLANNWAVGGTCTSNPNNRPNIPGLWITDQLPLALASTVDIVSVGGPHNDLVACQMTATQIVTDLTLIYQSLLAAGKAIIIATIPAYNMTNDQLNVLLAVRSWQSEFCRQVATKTGRCRLADNYAGTVKPLLVSNVGQTPLMKANYLIGDGIHPSTLGGYRMAQIYERAVYDLFPAVQNAGLVGDVNDAFIGPVQAATFQNPYGSLVTNGLMQNSGGTISGSVLSGIAPTGWTCAPVGSPAWTGSIVGSEIAAPDGVGNWFRLTFTNVAGGAYGDSVKCSQSNPPGTNLIYATGDKVYGTAEMGWYAAPSSVGLVTAGVQVVDNDGCVGTNFSESMGYNPNPSSGLNYWYFPSGEHISGVQRTQPITITPYCGSGTRTLETDILFYFDANAGFTGYVDVRRVGVRKANQL